MKKSKRIVMNQWQGINWKEGNWGIEQWEQLAQLLNSGQEFDFLRIQYPYLYYDSVTNHWYEIPLTVMPDAYWYTRDAIQRAVCQREIFSIFFRWEAGFSYSRKTWVWIREPNENGEPVNASDSYLSDNDQPTVVETSHGDLLRVGGDTVCFPQYEYSLDPILDVKCKNSHNGKVDGGVFIVPPDYQAKLFVNQIRSGE